jgi:Protein of unknown function (DUF1615)
MRNSPNSTLHRCLVSLALAGLAACTSSRRVAEPPVDPDVARAEIANRIPPKVANRDGWAVDIFAALEALSIRPTTENICAVIAVTEQESTFQANPTVPGLSAIARREIDARAKSYNIPNFLVDAALALDSPTGKSYRERLDTVKTEKALSEIFADFIRMVPLGERLFGNLNPVRTGGPMQVSIAFAEQHAQDERYPYPIPGTVREEVFTRRGGLYFGIAHLLDYPAPYDDMLYRFADFNAGHYASRNAAFQNALSVLAKTSLALDGDLLLHGSSADEPSKTELAARKLSDRLRMNDREIRRDLERGAEEDFVKTTLYERVFELGDRGKKSALPRAIVPTIRLQSPKITRKLTTEWFARRVDDRYERCLARSGSKPLT